MASPQKENGYMQLAVELVDIMAQVHLNGHENQLIWAVWRKTYCWHKKEDWISLSQLEVLTKLSRVSVCRAQKSLVSKKILLKKDGKLSFNKDYNSWVVSKTTLVSKTAIGSVKNVLPASVKNDTHKRYYTKDTYTKEELEKNMDIIKNKIHKKLI
jgi:phage replication O-like protein O